MSIAFNYLSKIFNPGSILQNFCTVLAAAFLIFSIVEGLRALKGKGSKGNTEKVITENKVSTQIPDASDKKFWKTIKIVVISFVVILGLIIAFIVIGSQANKSASSNTAANGYPLKGKDEFPTLSEKDKANFFNKYSLYYFDSARNFLENGKKIDAVGEKFTPDVLYSDGAYLASYSEVLNKVEKGQGSIGDVVDSSSQLNDWKIFFQGNTYESYDNSLLREKNFIFYVKCLKVEYRKDSSGNRCVRFALYSNNDEIDEGALPDETDISIGLSNIQPLFIKNGILYYSAKSDYYSYNPLSKSSVPYKPELFHNSENALLGILDNGDVIFSNSQGTFRNNLQAKIFDRVDGDQFIYAVGGMTSGNSYYYNTSSASKDKQTKNSFFKDNLLVAKIHSDVYGRMIDADKQDCHLGNSISGYLDLMYCLNKAGTIIRLDKSAVTDTTTPQAEKTVIYLVNNDVIDFSRFWTTKEGMNEKNVQSVSFIFDENGNVSSLLVEALEAGYTSNIYLIPYLGDGKIGDPQILVSNAHLFGVVKATNPL